MFKSNPEYCHGWQRQLAAKLAHRNSTASDLFMTLVEINKDDSIKKLVDARYLFTIKPFGHPSKMYYGYTLGDLVNYTDSIPRSCTSFVGWMPANEPVPNDKGASHNCRIGEFASGDGIEHIGALDYTSLKWNLAIRHYDFVARYYRSSLVELRQAKYPLAIVLAYEITSVLKTVGKKHVLNNY